MKLLNTKHSDVFITAGLESTKNQRKPLILFPIKNKHKVSLDTTAIKSKFEKELQKTIDEKIMAQVKSRDIELKIKQAEEREKALKAQRLNTLESKFKEFEERRQKYKEMKAAELAERDAKLKNLLNSIDNAIQNKQKIDEEKRAEIHEKHEEYKEKVSQMKQYAASASVEQDNKRIEQLERLEQECIFFYCIKSIKVQRRKEMRDEKWEGMSLLLQMENERKKQRNLQRIEINEKDKEFENLNYRKLQEQVLKTIVFLHLLL